jgi:hypothetical protein
MGMLQFLSNAEHSSVDEAGERCQRYILEHRHNHREPLSAPILGDQSYAAPDSVARA